MKTFTTLKVVVVLILVSLAWTSCKKEVSQPITPQFQDVQNVQNAKGLGAIKDNADAISKVHLIVSSEYLASRSEDFLYRRSPGGIIKPPKGGDRTLPIVAITSPANGA